MPNGLAEVLCKPLLRNNIIIKISFHISGQSRSEPEGISDCVYSLRNYEFVDIFYNHCTNGSANCFEGYYMYIETSYPRKNGEKARFISPTYPPVKGGQCFQFWYHMYGQDIGRLNVYIKTNANLSNPLWTRSGNRGNVWKITQISITTSSSFNVCPQFALVCFEIFLLLYRSNSSRSTIIFLNLKCFFFFLW